MKTLREYIYSKLRKSEKYLKTDMVYVFKGGSWLMFNQIVTTLFSFILSIVFAQYLSKEVFGTYKYIVSMAGILAAFSLTGMNHSVSRASAQCFDGVLRRSLLTQIKWCLPQFILTLSISGYYSFMGNEVYGISFLIIAFCLPLSTTANTYSAYLTGKKYFKNLAYYGIASNIAYFIVMLFVSLFYSNVIATVAGLYIITTVSNVFFCWRTIKKYKLQKVPFREDDIKFGKNLSAMNTVNMIAQHIDNVFLYHLLGPVQLAIYSFSIIIPDKLRSIFSVIFTLASPKLAELNSKGQTSNIKDKTIKLIILSVILIFTYILIAPYVYKLLFTKYTESIIYSQVFSLSILAIVTNISLPKLFAEKKQKELYIMSVHLPIFKIIISILLISMWGIWGAIISKVLHYTIHSCMSYYLASVKKTPLTL